MIDGKDKWLKRNLTHKKKNADYNDIHVPRFTHQDAKHPKVLFWGW